MRINNKVLKTILGVLFVFIMTFFLVKYKSVIFNMNVNNSKSLILKYGKYSSLFYVIIYSLKPIVLVIPASVLSIMAGNVFGSFTAFALSMVSCFFAATLAFFIAKFLGESFVSKILKGKKIEINSDILQHGFIIILLMRLSVIFAYDPLSFACGLTKMKYKDFILGTILGVIPEMATYSFIGDSINNPFSIKFILPIGMTIMIALSSYFIYKKFKKNTD